MKKCSVTVYIVDDDASVCRALTLLLEPLGFKVHTFTRSADFLASKLAKSPSCLVLDVNLPDTNGLKLQDAMSARKLSIPIIFITGYGNVPMSVKAMKAGAVDFLSKPFSERKLLDAIEAAIAKNKAENKKQTEEERIRRRIKTLTPRELQVFRLVAKGMLNKQIARKLGTVLQTIKIHRSRVMKKMQARSVIELTGFAQKLHIIPRYN